MLPISKESMQTLVVVWAILSFSMILMAWYSRRPGTGLGISYLFATSLIYVPGAIAYAMPQYQPTLQTLLDNQSSLRATQQGFEMTVLGLFGLAVGWLVGGLLIKNKERGSVPIPGTQAVRSKLPVTLLIMSLLIFFILAPVMRMIPSFGSIAAAGAGLSTVAVCVACWEAWQVGNHVRFYQWLFLSSLLFPFTTLVLMGFMSVGVTSVMSVWMFVFSYFRPRWLTLLTLICFLYGGMSFYVNYMRERNAIRQSVWGEQQISSRLDRMMDIVNKFEFLDFNNNFHMEALDIRLNQNHLTGLSVSHIGRGRVDFAKGYTLYIAATAWIPRILWPDKPSMAGSSGMVAYYTGLIFPKGTSVGIGHIMEFYINYGSWCVFLGVLIIGWILRWFDLRAGQYLFAGDYWNFGRWLLPASGLLNVAGNVATAVASTAAAFVFVTAVHRFFFAQYYVELVAGTSASPQIRQRKAKPYERASPPPSF